MKTTSLFLMVLIVLSYFSCADDENLVGDLLETGLNFTTILTFESDELFAPGMIGSSSDNSLFIATREDNLTLGSTGGPERILKIDLSTNTTKEIFFNQDDYKTKQIHIVDDRLVVVGGSFVNTYDLNLTADPISTSHGKRLSSFGTAILDDDIYIIGGDLTQVESDRIFKWDLNTNSLTEFEILLEPRFGARATIVNDTMYVFGGSETPFGEAENTIYEIPMNDPFNIGTFRMDLPAKFSFVQQFENTIFIAASMEQRAENGYVLYRESTIGIFDTHYNTYKEIETNLDNSSGLNTIYQMCILDNKMYIIYGNKEVNSSGPCNEWEVLVSELN